MNKLAHAARHALAEPAGMKCAQEQPSDEAEMYGMTNRMKLSLDVQRITTNLETAGVRCKVKRRNSQRLK